MLQRKDLKSKSCVGQRVQASSPNLVRIRVQIKNKMSLWGIVQQQNIRHSYIQRTERGSSQLLEALLLCPFGYTILHISGSESCCFHKRSPAPPSTFIQLPWHLEQLCLVVLLRISLLVDYGYLLLFIDLISLFMLLLLLLLVQLGRRVEIFNSENVSPPPLFFFKMVLPGKF